MCYWEWNFTASCCSPAVPGRCSLPYINVCAQQGKNAADRGGGCEMKKADPHSGFFCFL